MAPIVSSDPPQQYVVKYGPYCLLWPSWKRDFEIVSFDYCKVDCISANRLRSEIKPELSNAPATKRAFLVQYYNESGFCISVDNCDFLPCTLYPAVVNEWNVNTDVRPRTVIQIFTRELVTCAAPLGGIHYEDSTWQK